MTFVRMVILVLITMIIKNMRIYIKQKETLLCHLLKFKCKRRCEICIVVVKIKPLHAHLNHLIKQCRVYVAKMIFCTI